MTITSKLNDITRQLNDITQQQQVTPFDTLDKKLNYTDGNEQTSLRLLSKPNGFLDLLFSRREEKKGKYETVAKAAINLPAMVVIGILDAMEEMLASKEDAEIHFIQAINYLKGKKLDEPIKIHVVVSYTVATGLFINYSGIDKDGDKEVSITVPVKPIGFKETEVKVTSINSGNFNPTASFARQRAYRSDSGNACWSGLEPSFNRWVDGIQYEDAPEQNLNVGDFAARSWVRLMRELAIQHQYHGFNPAAPNVIPRPR